MNKEFIIEKLLCLDLSKREMVEQYVSFCLNNDVGQPARGKTHYHHILPKGKTLFPEYADLKINKWNGVHLTHDNHFKAHDLLSKAIDNESISWALWRISTLLGYTNKVKNHPNLGKSLMKDKDGNYKWANPNDPNLVHIRKGVAWSDESRRKHSETINRMGANSGSNNPRAKEYKIYDDSNELRFVVTGNLRKLCKEIGLPFGSARKALDTNNGIIYKNPNNTTLTVLKRNGTDKFINWKIIKS